MPYVSTNYLNNEKAPQGQWACAPTSKLGPFAEVPAADTTRGPDYCGQCVSYVKHACPTLPATSSWKKGAAVKDNTTIKGGTVIATFNDAGSYLGHAAIYVSHNSSGITVYDQWVTAPSPKSISMRVLRWGGNGTVNNGDKYHVVD